jgi:hypothetical protein
MLHLTSSAAADRRPSNLVTVSFAAGEIQFVEQSGGVLIDLPSHRFDLEGYPQSDHACTTITRSEAHLLVVALVTLLAGPPESRKAADEWRPVTSSGGLLTSVKSPGHDTQVQEPPVSVTHS